MFLIERLKKGPRLGFVFAPGFDFESRRGSHGIPGNFLNIASRRRSLLSCLHPHTTKGFHAGEATSTISTSGFRCNVMETRRESRASVLCQHIKVGKCRKGKTAECTEKIKVPKGTSRAEYFCPTKLTTT